MNALDKAYGDNAAFVSAVHDKAMQLKQVGELITPADSFGGQFGDYKSQAAYQEHYDRFVGWLYSAIHTLAMKGAGQPVCVGRLLGASPREEGKRAPATRKAFYRRRMTAAAFSKSAEEELEVLADHPWLDMLEKPNPIQSRWEFVYNFITNLLLTGRSYIVGGMGKDGMEYYSLPTTWVHPDHTDGPFSKYRVYDPDKPMADREKILGPELVKFAYMPDPMDPLAAKAPAGSQIRAIRIDDNVQASEETFFGNFVHPSVIITVGKDSEGKRPRLTNKQRRQVMGAVSKLWQGVANRGVPAIVDNWIESIEPFTTNQNEIGWEKTEKQVRTRILSATGVHPFEMGEPMNVGGYSQASVIDNIFCERVNTVMDMLGIVMTEFTAADDVTAAERLLVWWEKCEAKDPDLDRKWWAEARKNGDVTQNEFRAEMGLPPDEDGNEALVSPQMLAQINYLLANVGNGKITPAQARAALISIGLPDDTAEEMAGPEREEETTVTEEGALAEATEVLEEAVAVLGISPKVIADKVLVASK